MIETAGVYYSSFTPAGTITEPVLPAEAKAFAKIGDTTTEEDAELEEMLIGCREDIENYCDINLVDGSVVVYVNVKDENFEMIMFPEAIREMIDPNSMVVNFISKGNPDELQVIDEDYYFSDMLSFAATGKYRLNYDIVVQNVPATIKQAIKMLFAYRYENRGDQDKSEQQGIPDDVKQKVARYQHLWL
jgi:hypothetical protein